MMKDRVLSGMQPSGRLHIGNLVGVLKNWVRLQDIYDCFYFVADWHSLTTDYANPLLIKDNTKDLLINFLAAGLDPDKTTIFIQSMIPEHAELHLLLSMITPISWLERVPTYKEKQQEIKDKDLSTFGFLGYPVLQTADILIYKAKYVPIGIDQMPHLEISREIARRFNFMYNREFFLEPEGLLAEFPRVIGLDGRKMSKSYNNAIYLSDTPEIIEQKIKTMMTDPRRERKTDKGNPELSPVYQLHKIFSSREEMDYINKECRIAGIGCIDCKKILIKNILNYLEPIWLKRQSLINHPDMIYDIVKTGCQRARFIANKTIETIRTVMLTPFASSVIANETIKTISERMGLR